MIGIIITLLGVGAVGCYLKVRSKRNHGIAKQYLERLRDETSWDNMPEGPLNVWAEMIFHLNDCRPTGNINKVYSKARWIGSTEMELRYLHREVHAFMALKLLLAYRLDRLEFDRQHLQRFITESGHSLEDLGTSQAELNDLELQSRIKNSLIYVDRVFVWPKPVNSLIH